MSSLTVNKIRRIWLDLNVKGSPRFRRVGSKGLNHFRLYNFEVEAFFFPLVNLIDLQIRGHDFEKNDAVTRHIA